MKKLSSKSHQNFIRESGAGFTMLELIITIAILSFGIIGVYSTLTSVSSLNSELSFRFTAANLAQEGMEIIRNMRDNNYIQGLNWSQRIGTCQNGCEADYTTDTKVSGAKPLTAYGQGNFLNIDDSGFYSYGAGAATKFKRKITVDEIQETDDILKIDVLVLWDYKEKSYSFNTIGYLYDWK